MRFSKSCALMRASFSVSEIYRALKYNNFHHSVCEKLLFSGARICHMKQDQGCAFKSLPEIQNIFVEFIFKVQAELK